MRLTRRSLLVLTLALGASACAPAALPTPTAPPAATPAPARKPVATEGDHAQIRYDARHHLDLRRENGQWQVVDFN